MRIPYEVPFNTRKFTSHTGNAAKEKIKVPGFCVRPIGFVSNPYPHFLVSLQVVRVLLLSTPPMSTKLKNVEQIRVS